MHVHVMTLNKNPTSNVSTNLKRDTNEKCFQNYQNCETIQSNSAVAFINLFSIRT